MASQSAKWTDEDVSSVPFPVGSTVGFVRLAHSMPDTRIDYATFQFIVTDERLGDLGIDPSNVSLYRWHDQQWNQLNTVHLRELDSTHQFRADAPGMSVFAISHSSNRVLGTAESRSTDSTTTTATSKDRTATAVLADRSTSAFLSLQHSSPQCYWEATRA